MREDSRSRALVHVRASRLENFWIRGNIMPLIATCASKQYFFRSVQILYLLRILHDFRYVSFPQSLLFHTLGNQRPARTLFLFRIQCCPAMRIFYLGKQKYEDVKVAEAEPLFRRALKGSQGLSGPSTQTR
eukprot:g73320.t1